MCGFFSFLKFLFVWLRVCLDTTYFAKNLKLIAENTVAKYFLKNKNTETSLHKHTQKSLLDAKQTHQNYGR